jgi:hypothetical protein
MPDVSDDKCGAEQNGFGSDGERQPSLGFVRDKACTDDSNKSTLGITSGYRFNAELPAADQVEGPRSAADPADLRLRRDADAWVGAFRLMMQHGEPFHDVRVLVG